MMKTKISLSNNPEYKAAWEKLQTLNGEMAATEKKIDNLHGSLADGEKSDPLTEEAERYLTGGEYVPRPQNTMRGQVQELYDKRSVIRRAIQVQRKKLAEIRGRVSEEICQAVRPEYAKIVEKHVDLIKKLSAVADEERELRQKMEEEDLVWKSHIPPMPLFGIGSLKESQSFAARYIKEAEQHEYI